MTSTTNPNVDVIESSIGSFGRYHIFLTISIFLVKFSIAWHQLGIVILAPVTEFECSNKTLDKCSPDCPSHLFNKSIFEETIITQWDLVCERKELSNLAQLTFMFGVLLGNFIFGFLSDRFGRRNPLVWTVVLQVASGVGAAFAPWYWLFIVLRALCALATGGTMITSFVLLMEIIGKEKRTSVGILYQLPSDAGYSLLGLFGYLIRDWHYIQMAISIPSVILIAYYWIIPESPRWLLTVGRTEESIAVMQKIAGHNHLSTNNIKENITNHVENMPPSKQHGGNVFDLIRTKEMRIRSLCMFFNWLSTGMSFFGVAQYMTQMGGDIFVNIAIAGLVQIPGIFIVLLILGRVGRKSTLICTNVLCGVACLLITVIPTEPFWPTLVLVNLSMMGISMSFNILYVYSGELFPTVVRNMGMGSASMFSRVGSMVAPFVAELGTVQPWLPPLIFGLMPLISTAACFRLPETLNNKLPDTIEEAEQIGRLDKPPDKMRIITERQ
ncbi:uncharacterized protein CBL_07604 [Carabus blaptoides fortunei]